MEFNMELSNSDSNASVSTINLDKSVNEPLLVEVDSSDESDMDQDEDDHQNTRRVASPTVLTIEDDDNDEAHPSPRENLNRIDVAAIPEAIPSSAHRSVESFRRKCIVCLVQKAETEDVFQGRYVRKEIYILLEHLQTPIRGNCLDTGLCYDCMNQLQRWHMFYQTRKALLDKNPPRVFQPVQFPPSPTLYERTNDGIPVPIVKIAIPVIRPNPVSYTERKVNQICKIYDKSEHQDCMVRGWTEDDLEYLAYHIHNAESLKSPAVAKLKLYFTDDKMLLRIYCFTCKKHISGGKAKYEEHVTTDHDQDFVLFPCDICGICLPDDNSCGTNNFFEHWLSHFYFYSCNECEAILPSHRKFLRHMENVHKKPNEPLSEYGGAGVHFEPEPMPSITPWDGEEDPEDDGNVPGQHNKMMRKELERKKRIPHMVCKDCNKRIQRPFYKYHQKNCHVKIAKTAANRANVPKRAAPSSSKMATAAKPQPANEGNNNAATTSGMTKKYSCQTCGRDFSRPNFLQDHINFVHLNIKNYKCGVCSMSFISNCHLKSHEMKHNRLQTSQETSFDCDKCHKKYFDKGSLEGHHCVTEDGPQSKHFKLLSSFFGQGPTDLS